METAALTCFDEGKSETQGILHAGRLLELFLQNRRQHGSKEEDEGEGKEKGRGGTGRGESIVGLWRKRKRKADKIIEVMLLFVFVQSCWRTVGVMSEVASEFVVEYLAG